MHEQTMIVTTEDMERLRDLIRAAKTPGWPPRPEIRRLELELDRAAIVSPTDVPRTAMTMGSRAHLVDLSTHEERIVTLVDPQAADRWPGKLSILAPLGTRLLGSTEGDVVDVNMPAGIDRLHVKEILYQPEAAGNGQRRCAPPGRDAGDQSYPRGSPHPNAQCACSEEPVNERSCHQP
jgi:regulator of nucleoside diphosphate kinase